MYGPDAIRTFDELWRGAAHLYRDRPFLVFQEDDGLTTSFTYGEIDKLVEHTSQTLAALGVQHGDAVHLCVRNSPAFLMVWLATARIGAWMIPADPGSTSSDLRAQFRLAQPKVGICGDQRSDVYLEAARECGLHVLAVTESAADTFENSPLLDQRSDPPLEFGPCAPGDRMAVLFTSGTTSTPKGAVLTHANYVNIAFTMAGLSHLRPESRWLVTLPLFHGNAQYYCFCPAIAVGASVALTSRFSASRWTRQARELHATHASLFAAPIRMILARRTGKAPRLSLEHVWFAQNLAESQYEEFASIVGCRPRQLYGMTETCSVVTADLRPVPGHDTMGTPIPGRDIELFDMESGHHRVGVGAPGVLYVRGSKGQDLFLEYLSDPVRTDASYLKHNGEDWLCTGDVVRRDPDGSLHFIGRIDDIIKVAGENVSLAEVETAIAHAPGVLEAAVLPEPDPIRDTVPVAYVVPRDQKRPPSVATLDAWAARQLTPQSRPRRWVVIDELPRTSVGKIRRFKLAEPEFDSDRSRSRGSISGDDDAGA